MLGSPVDEKEKDTTFESQQLPYATQSSVDPRRVLRKLDRHLLPFVSILYLLSFL